MRRAAAPLGAIAAAGLVAGATTPATALELYNDFYNHFNSDSSLVKDGQNPPDDVASWAYATNSADGFGGVVGFNRPANRLERVSVIMSNFHGVNTNSNTASYQTDITLELYDVDRSGPSPAPGASIATDTETHEIAGRQVPDAANAAFAGSGTDFIIDWALDDVEVGDEVLFIVRLDHFFAGSDFTDPDDDGALGSLNIAAAASGTPPDVTAGVDTDPGVYWRSDASTGGDISRFEAGQVLARVEGAAIPLPAALPLLGLGLAGLAALRRGARR